MPAAAAPILTIRPARIDDAPALERLIAASARALGAGFYSPRETEAAIAHVFGVDSALIADGSYFVVESADGSIAACGGWSDRRTLFGSDRAAGRDAARLDPREDPARIRAFFVAPAWARRGVGGRMLRACEDAARAAGFTRAALMATLPGVPFYAAHGYTAGEAIAHPCGDVTVGFVPMHRVLSDREVPNR